MFFILSVFEKGNKQQNGDSALLLTANVKSGRVF